MFARQEPLDSDSDSSADDKGNASGEGADAHTLGHDSGDQHPADTPGNNLLTRLTSTCRRRN